LGVSKQVEGLPILPFHELYQKIKGTKPSGPLWEIYLTCLALNGTMQRLLALPPGAPQAAVDALRAAVLRLNNDTAFADDAMKTLGFVPEFHAGPETNRTVSNTLTLKQEIRDFVANYLKEAGK